MKIMNCMDNEVLVNKKEHIVEKRSAYGIHPDCNPNYVRLEDHFFQMTVHFENLVAKDIKGEDISKLTEFYMFIGMYDYADQCRQYIDLIYELRATRPDMIRWYGLHKKCWTNKTYVDVPFNGFVKGDKYTKDEIKAYCISYGMSYLKEIRKFYRKGYDMEFRTMKPLYMLKE